VDLDVGVLRLELVADLVFQLMGELAVVQRQQLALVLRVRVDSSSGMSTMLDLKSLATRRPTCPDLSTLLRSMSRLSGEPS
jgi:hypothetical protein